MYPVLHLIPDLGTGGAERMLVHLALGQRGTEVNPYVATLYGPADTELERELQLNGVPVYGLGKKRGFDPRMFAKIYGLLRQIKPALVHSHRAVLKYALPAMVAQRIPGIHTIHNMAQVEADVLGRIAQAVAFRTLVAPIAICGAVRESVKRMYLMEPAAIVRNGIPIPAYTVQRSVSRDLWRRENDVGADTFVFLAASRLAPQKDLVTLIKAFSGLPREPASLLLLAGEGPQRSALEKLTAALQEEDRVRLLGVRVDMPNLYAAADTFVMSSLWEGLPLAVMEAMAAGLPVIATSVGGVDELVQQHISGILVSPGDHVALRAAMREVQLSGRRRRELGEAAARRAREMFDVASMVKSYLATYRTRLLTRVARGTA